MDETLDALLALLPLERLPRTGWVLRGVGAPEPVAGHVLGTALVALALAPRVEPPLDVDRAVSLAVLHDAPEALSGDLPKRASQLLPEGAKAHMERAAARELLAPLSDAALERYEEYAAGETREARFVKLCDRLQLGLRLVAYVRAGERGLGEFRRGLEALDCSGFAPAAELRARLLEALDEAARC
jgi:putative hydrolase of HD superfamily